MFWILYLLISIIEWMFWASAWVLGFFSAAQIIYALTKYFYREAIRKPHDLLQRYGPNSWVIVTGATGGIGEEYCKQFAQKGFNIILFGKDRIRLDQMEAKIQNKYPNIKTRTCLADFSESIEEEFYMNIKKQLEGLDISVLVNNAGIATFQFFEKIPPQELKDMIQTNAAGCTMLTRIFIGDMLKRDRRSAIINVGSVLGYTPVGFVGCYSATKAFLRFLSYILHEVYKDKIDVQNLTPGYVTTKMVGYTTAYDSCSPEYCVKSSLKCLGNEMEISPYFIHSYCAFRATLLWRFFPKFWDFWLSTGDMRVVALEVFKDKYDQKL